MPSNRKENVEPYDDNEESSEPEPGPELEVTVESNKEINQQPYPDKLFHKEVTLKCDDLIQRGKVKRITLSTSGSVTGSCNENIILNALTCDKSSLKMKIYRTHG